MKRKQHIVLCFFLFFKFSFAQESTTIDTTAVVQSDRKLDFNVKQVIIPAVFITYGVVGLESGQIKGFNSGISEEVQEHIDEKITIDDFSQYMPMASLYVLPALGVKSKNSFKDRTIILATSSILMGLTVTTLKTTTKVQRPDGSSFNSFPSGHTATAFMGAELMYQEFKEESVWYGISGFVVAAGTGAFRMYNNRHWLTDVVAGAGIGILSAKAGYWLYPLTSKIFYNKKNKSKTVFVPFYDGNNTGFGLVSKF